MTKSTHLAAGLFFAIATSCTAPATVLVCVGSLLPDIDTAASTFGKKAKCISKVLEHRGPTHSLVFALATAFISPYLCIGVLSHILMDFLNPKGVKLIWPLGRNMSFPLLSSLFITGGKGEKIVRYILYFLSGLYIVFSLIINQSDWQNELVTCFNNAKTNIIEISQYISQVISYFNSVLQ